MAVKHAVSRATDLLVLLPAVYTPMNESGSAGAKEESPEVTSLAPFCGIKGGTNTAAAGFSKAGAVTFATFVVAFAGAGGGWENRHAIFCVNKVALAFK